MRLISLSAAFVLALTASLPAQDGDKATLEWKFKKGESLRYQMTMVMEMDMGGMQISQEMLFRWLWDVTDVGADGTGTMKATYERVKMKMDGPMAAEYDSESGKKPADTDFMGRIMASFVGKSLTLQMSKQGQCLKMEGMEKLMDSALKELPEEMQAMAAMMKASMTDDYSKSMMQLHFGFLPKTAVAKGDTWDDKASLSMGMLGKMDLKSKSTLKEIRDGKEAVIGQETKFEFKPGDGGPMGPMEVTEAKLKNEVVWLLDKGCPQVTKGTMTMDMSAGGQEISMVWKMEMKLLPATKDAPKADGGSKDAPPKDAPKDTPKDPPKEPKK